MIGLVVETITGRVGKTLGSGIVNLYEAYGTNIRPFRDGYEKFKVYNISVHPIHVDTFVLLKDCSTEFSNVYQYLVVAADL